MYWKLTCTPCDTTNEPPGAPPQFREARESLEKNTGGSRFVLHRHGDDRGPHLDLRIEENGCLGGWRVDALSLRGEPWAEEKAPHPLDWLDREDGVLTEDAGTCLCLSRALPRQWLLKGTRGFFLLTATPVTEWTPARLKTLTEAVPDPEARDALPALAADGLTARRHAITRFCGLGRELDGKAFDETVWRKALEALSLEEIHQQLQALECRFDRHFQPERLSRPEPLPPVETDGRAGRAMNIALGNPVPGKERSFPDDQKGTSR